MTTWEDVQNNSSYVKVLDTGFVGLIESMGSDSSIVQAARLSYGSGTKTVREDRGLIRYLIRNRHTSPLEMCQVKIHIKLPIFVMRQLIRHRTASINEYSGRYSVMTDEFYIPDVSQIRSQSTTNKQGRADPVSVSDALKVQDLIRTSCNQNYKLYQQLLGDEEDHSFSNEFEGLARESARIVLPVNNYTEVVWCQNLHNLFHLLKLRMDEHSQWEIRQYADCIYKLVQPLFPLACEAFEDYINQSVLMSRMEINLMRELLQEFNLTQFIKQDIEDAGSKKEYALAQGLNERELNEFFQKCGLTI
jgi:thymidylate synthase (FAD)